jgi:hypothetical protein
LIDTVATLAIDCEREFVSFSVHVDPKPSRYSIEKASVFGEQCDRFVDQLAPIVEILLQERACLADVEREIVLSPVEAFPS